MKKAALLSFLILSLLSLQPANAQGRLHRRCGTSMLLQREATISNGHTRAIDASQHYVPHSGTVTIPVILVEFNDVKFTVNNPKEAFNQLFNGTSQEDMGNGNQNNHGSVAQYFRDMSNGSLNLQFQVYGPVTLSANETRYGGANEDDNSDEDAWTLVSDAISGLQSTDERVTDTSAFCSDGSNVDCVYVIYAGLGQNDGGDGTTVWASTGNIQASLAGSPVRWYSMAPELAPYAVGSDGSLQNFSGSANAINGIGVTCHEFSHALGLPDFYTTNSDAAMDNQEMEYWDLMDGGEYSGNGYCPTAYTAFEKNEMGWSVDIRELTEDANISMSTPTEQGGTAYKITNPQNSNEYLMLENIQKRGWNSHQYGNGLLVYHVNRPNGGLTMGTAFNNIPGYPGMAVVPADGLVAYNDKSRYTVSFYFESQRGDLFPGIGNMTTDTLDVTELSDAMPKPNFCWYNSARTQKIATGKALRNIAYDTATGTISFQYINDTTSGIENISNDKKDTNSPLYTIDGRYMGTDIRLLPPGLYIKDGKKVMKQ